MIGQAATLAGLTLGGTFAATTGTIDVPSLIGTVVTPVAVLLLIVTGWLHTKGDYERVVADVAAERAARDTERTARDELQRVITAEIVPALTRSTDAIKTTTDLMESMARRQAGGV